MAAAREPPVSMVFSEEETEYLKAVMTWGGPAPDPVDRRRRRATREALRPPPLQLGTNTRPPVGEFRILVIGAKGVGKTSILTRFCQGRLPEANEPHDPFFEQGCRHVTEIDGQNYTVDALEMPSKHLWRDDVVQQAIHITEAAVLIYDVTAPDSLRLARGLQELVRDTIDATGAATGQRRRDYGLVLVGNKSDIDDEDRRVSWAEGSRTAAAFDGPTSRCAFLEVSARSGDNVATLFPHIGREILRLRRLNQQARRETREPPPPLPIEAVRTLPVLRAPPKHHGGIWKRIRRPFSRQGVATV